MTSTEHHDGYEGPVDSSGGASADKMSDERHDDLGGVIVQACSAPPVPASLAARIDSQFSERWGKSPGIAPQAEVRLLGLAHKTQWFRTAHWLRTAMVTRWPASVAVAASLLMVVVLTVNSGGYAWASVLEAIRQNGFIQMRDGSQTSALDLSQDSFVDESGKRIQWHDQQAMLFAFLRQEPMTLETLRRYEAVSIVQEQWTEVERDGETQIDFSVTFQTKDHAQFSLDLQLDPVSSLPSLIRPGRSDDSPIALAFSQSAPRDGSSSMTVAGVNRATRSLAQNRQDQFADGSGALPGRHGSEAVVSSESLPGTGPGAEDGPKDSVAMDTVGINHSESLPRGAPSKWSPVQVVSRDHEQTVQEVNRVLGALWQRRGIEPVERASDLELMRRAYLDLAGRIPSVTEVRKFADQSGDNRYRLMIDELLQSPDHPSQLAAIWRSFLIPEGVDLESFGGREAFEKWLTDRFASGDAYDKIVRELLLAEGRLTQSGPLLFYASLKLDADQLAARTSRAFLGVRLECAQCHDHFFESWTQDDFWSFAAFFAQISRPKGDLENVSKVMRVSDVERGEVMLPDTDTVVAPRFLGATGDQSSSRMADGDRRKQLAAWLTGAENPYFARATVNRVWARLFGRGIVDPVDDFGSSNDAVSPELLDTLASYFIQTDFDLQALIRVIAHSDAYQLSSSHMTADSETTDSKAAGDAAKRLAVFAQMNVKTLTAEQLYDCIAIATGMDANESGRSGDALSRFGNSRRDEFLQTFAAPQTNLSEYHGGIPQALTLMNGSLSAAATGESTSGLIRSLRAPFFTDEQRIEIVFLATLSRKPTAAEQQLVADFIPRDATAEQRRQGMADLLWALMNSSEFTLNH